jgi:dsRNA-specific ribonuclease
LLSNALLGTKGRDQDMASFVYLDPRKMRKPKRVRIGTLATTVEAIIGAVYKDRGFEAAKAVIQQMGLMSLKSRQGRNIKEFIQQEVPTKVPLVSHYLAMSGHS